MPFLKSKCPHCQKTLEVEKTYYVSGRPIHTTKCGHIVREEVLEVKSPETIVSLDGRALYNFQKDGVRFVERSNARALIADEMGLGKTVQALSSLALHPELLPALIIVKSSLKYQWQHEFMRWIGDDGIAQVIDSAKDQLLKGLPAFIISFDLIPRMMGTGSSKREKKELSQTTPYKKGGTLKEQMNNVGIKTIIIDECQQIKNPSAQRSSDIRELTRDVPHVIALSGTPIKNNAAEYFSILNILKPELFPTYSGFIQRWTDSYWSGYAMKTGGLKNAEAFQKWTKDFIIRRERKEVMPDLPSISRNFSFCDLAEEVEEAYKATFTQFRDDFNSGNGSNSFEESSNILAYLSKMRHLTGLSKINPAIDFVEEFLEGTSRKLTIFVHHKDVGELMKMKLTSLCNEKHEFPPLTLTADLDSEARAEVVNKFMNGSFRILIASTLASGEGLNLQKCSDCIMLERQWNPANEEQAEGRFIRIGQTAEAVTATYFVALGTVDEFFSEIVERKREIVTKTLGGESAKWDQSSLMKELAENLAASGGRKWGI